jgi:L-rhamnose mutarotase
MTLENVNKRVGSLIKLKPEYEERYIILHKHVFPGVLDRIRNSHIRNYSIFLLNGILFSYLEYVGNNYDEDMKAIAGDITKEWWKLTDPMQEPLPSRKENEWWAEMKLLRHFDETTKPYPQVRRLGYTAEMKRDSEQIIKNLFNDFNEKLVALFKKAHIQNHSVFLKDRNVYIYFEYTGNNFSKDNEGLKNLEELKKWNDKLKQCLAAAWGEMQEVFHTD